MRNPVRSEFYRFTTKQYGENGVADFFSLNVSGARQIVISANNSRTFVTNEPRVQCIDAGGNLEPDCSIFMIPQNFAVTALSNDENLNIGIDGAKGTEEVYVWVIR